MSVKLQILRGTSKEALIKRPADEFGNLQQRLLEEEKIEVFDVTGVDADSPEPLGCGCFGLSNER